MRASGKANLVIDDDMNCAASPVTAQGRESKCFCDNALTSKSSITM